jgi:hypothetical protein
MGTWHRSKFRLSGADSCGFAAKGRPQQRRVLVDFVAKAGFEVALIDAAAF